MRKSAIIMAFAAIAGLAGTALAHEGTAAKHDVQQEQRITPDDMKAKLDKLGYEVRRIRVEHGKYKAHLIERQTGRAVQATFDTATGDLVRAKLRS